MRLGLRYVKGLSEISGKAIELERKKSPFTSIDDLHQRVPELRKDELRKLAAVGALNFIQSSQESNRKSQKSKSSSYSSFREYSAVKDGTEPAVLSAISKPHSLRNNPTVTKLASQSANRRDALWQVERVARSAGPLFEELHEQDGNSPLAQMTVSERMSADFRGTGLTIGKHPVAMYRSELNKLGATRATEIYNLRNGLAIRVAGWVIVRQRPGTAKGFMFLTLEDETGVANIIVTPQLFDKNRHALVDYPFLMIEGHVAKSGQRSVGKSKTHPATFIQSCRRTLA
ncbi:MAG TPA: hypothetical protein VGN86_09070 [Pyrinomonadaceae bacterium]|nr:hypothetical protein [Pyrinomonadaceae bacterium]